MPPGDAQTKTEAPTPRRRREARRQGQVARSRDLSSALVLLIGTAILAVVAPELGRGLVRALQQATRGAADGSVADWTAVAAAVVGAVAGETLLLLAAYASVAFVADACQVGFYMAYPLLSPRLERLSPLRGLRRLVEGWWLRLVLAVAKGGAVLAVVCAVLWLRADQFAGLAGAPVGTIVATSWSLAMWALAGAAATLLVLALADYGYQRWRHEQELRMTRQELKEELKRDEGDPMVRARIRSLQREYARRRMLDDVATATVVITNPTHVAVALRYERGLTAAPVVVAKGVARLAEAIIERAQRAGVPVVRRAALARVLYRSVAVGQEIPVALYFAVAEVLAFVYKMRGHFRRSA